MTSPSSFLIALLFALIAANGPVWAQTSSAGSAPASMPLIDFNSPDAAKQVGPTKGVPPTMFTVDKTGISMGFPIQPAPHSGVIVTSATGKPWDLSAYGHIEVKVTNTA